MVIGQLVMPVQCCAEAPAAAVEGVHDKVHYKVHDKVHDKDHDKVHDKVHDRYQDLGTKIFEGAGPCMTGEPPSRPPVTDIL